MSAQDDGGPFHAQESHYGTSMRDVIAIHAMQALLMNPEVSMEESHITKWAYKYADAMLQARKEKAP